MVAFGGLLSGGLMYGGLMYDGLISGGLMSGGPMLHCRCLTCLYSAVVKADFNECIF